MVTRSRVESAGGRCVAPPWHSVFERSGVAPYLVEAIATVATQLMCGGVCQRPVLGYFVDEIIVSDNRIDVVVDWLDYVGDTRFERTFTFDDAKTRFVPLREFEPSRDGRARHIRAGAVCGDGKNGALVSRRERAPRARGPRCVSDIGCSFDARGDGMGHPALARTCSACHGGRMCHGYDEVPPPRDAANLPCAVVSGGGRIIPCEPCAYRSGKQPCRGS
jgi:hypothetical protein